MTRTRAKVIAATLELITERGIPAATIEAVCERSGVAKTTIYRHWPNQHRLTLDAIASTLREPADPDTGTLRGDLIVLLCGLASAIQTGPAAPLMPALIDAAARDPAFAALHRAEAATRHGVILDVIRRGIGRGELPAGTKPADVLDLLAGPVLHRSWMTGKPVTRRWVTRVVDVTLAGLS
ncbi:MAG: TetR/AcrR family transcriptional regulator [Actinobacteria bacterium]|nr:TetR/AcrR family transcriptional regulator [Actinomycetota bacterium]